MESCLDVFTSSALRREEVLDKRVESSTNEARRSSLDVLIKEKEELLWKRGNIQDEIVSKIGPIPSSAVLCIRDKDCGDTLSDENLATKEYHGALTSLRKLQEVLRNQENEYGAAARELDKRLTLKEQKADGIFSAFRKFQSETAENAVDSCTGKPIPKAKLCQIELEEKNKNETIERERLKALKKKIELMKLEKCLKSKETLAEGLNLSDFEQLQIENRTFTKKKGGRDDEIKGLMASHKSSAIAISHINQKLSMMKKLKGELQGALETIDKKFSISQRVLISLTQELESLKKQNGKNNQDTAVANKVLIIEDYKKSENDLIIMQNRLSELKAHYHILTS